MTFEKMNPFCHSKSFRVFARERERIIGNVHRVQLSVGKTCGERENNHAAAGPDIENARILRPLEIAEIFHQLLRFGAWNERALVGSKNVIGEFDRAEQMLERLALSAPPNELAQRRQFRLREGALELEVKFDPFFA